MFDVHECKTEFFVATIQEAKSNGNLFHLCKQPNLSNLSNSFGGSNDRSQNCLIIKPTLQQPTSVPNSPQQYEENIELRKDKNPLRMEIGKFKNELKEQQRQLNYQAMVIKRLSECFEVESRNAIRLLINDAEKRMKEDDNLYSGNEKKILCSQAFARNLKESPEIVPVYRIKVAIDAKEDIRQRNYLLQIFSKTYPDYQELGEEDNDIWNELDDEGAQY